MGVTISELGRHFVVGWVNLIRRFAAVCALIAVCATLGIAYFVVQNVSINTDTEDMLSADLPFRVNSRALSEAFPQFSDNILVVIDGHTPDVADDAAIALGEAMRATPGQFGDVYDLAGHPFFRKNGLLYLDVDELYDLSDRLAEAQPFLGTLWRDPSLRGLLELLSRAVDELVKDDGGDVPIEIARVLDAMSATLEAQKERRFGRLSWQQLMMEEADSQGPYRRFILIQPALDFGSLQPAQDAIDALRALANDLHLTSENGVRVRLTGSAAMAQEELKSVEQGMGLAALLSLVLVVALLLIGLRSIKLAAATLITLIMGLIWTAGFAVAAVGQLNLISVAFAVLFIGLSVDFGIHFGLRYKEAIDHGTDHADALGEAARSVGGALTLCAVAAAIGFLSFLPTDYRGLAELGLIAGAGMFIALFSNMTVLPALISLAPLCHGATGFGGTGFSLSAVAARNARAVLWGALALGVGSALLVPKARFDFDPLNLKDRNTESVATYFDLIEGQHTGPYSVTVLEKNLFYANELSKKFNVLDEVKETATLADYVPSDQQEKLDVIGTMALFIAPALTGENRAAAPQIDQNRAALITAINRLNRLVIARPDSNAGRSAARLALAIDALGGAHAGDTEIGEMQDRLVSSLPKRLAHLRSSLDAAFVDLDALPAQLRTREIASDGRARLEVYPQEDLTDREALKRFVAAVREVAPNVTGGPVIILEAGDAVVEAFRDAALIALGGIAILLALVLRNVRDTLLVFAPLVLATLLVVSCSVLFELPFNFANVIVLPLLFGLGVANSIHVVLRSRDDAGKSGVFATSTPRAVVFSALTTVGSFGSIALSSHPGTASMGVLLTIAISLTLICTLVLLPALMALWPPLTER